jgi:hypothetical protein
VKVANHGIMLEEGALSALYALARLPDSMSQYYSA